MNRIFRYTIFYLLIFLVIIGILGTFNNSNQPTQNISYNEFLEALNAGEIENVTIQPDAQVYEVTGELASYDEGESFVTNVPIENEALVAQIDELATAQEGVEVEFLKAPQTSGWVDRKSVV